MQAILFQIRIILLAALCLGCMNLTHAANSQAATSAPETVQQVIQPDYLTAKELSQTIRDVFPTLTVTPHQSSLILSGPKSDVAQAAALIEQIDVPPQAVDVFFDFSHRTPIEYKHEHSTKYQTHKNTADLSVTGFMNEPIFVEMNKREAFALFPLLAFKDVTASKQALVEITPSKTGLWVTISTTYLSRNSGQEQNISTKVLVQPNEWYILEPEQPHQLVETNNNKKVYTTQSRISSEKTAVKVILK